MPKILTLKQLLKKKYNFLDDLPERIQESFGQLVMGFVLIIWGESGNGKSNCIMQFIGVLLKYGKALYVGLEEGTRVTMQNLAKEYFDKELHQGKIAFTDHTMTYQELLIHLRRRKSAHIIIIDSLQYWNITYEQYKALKEEFPRKIFIFVSHTNGKLPDGKNANKVRYDADIKVFCEGYIAFIKSRLGGNKPYVIWEEGARVHWGKDYHKKSTGIKSVKKKPAPAKKVEEPEAAPVTTETEVQTTQSETA